MIVEKEGGQGMTMGREEGGGNDCEKGRREEE